eukprot:CCRYP_018273-RA/>CCRYP_018273-RA protein AED:0.34 eAED:0.34 QI:1694/1/1/1/0/0/2/1/567
MGGPPSFKKLKAQTCGITNRNGFLFYATISAVALTGANIWMVMTGRNGLQTDPAKSYFSSTVFKALSLVIGYDNSDLRGSQQNEECCKTLIEHIQGHWQHHFVFFDDMSDMVLADPSIKEVALPVTDELLNHTNIQSMYVSEEINWLRGRGLPRSTTSAKSWEFHGYHCRYGGDTDEDRGISYLSTIGNQCGCALTTFQPSHSYWLDGGDKEITTVRKYSAAVSEPSDNSEQKGYNILEDNSPSLRLARHFARKNQTLCFAGDSIDFQFYFALKNNLHRAELLQQKHFNTSLVNVSSHHYPTRYRTEVGDPMKGYRLGDGDWKLAEAVYETVVTFHDESINAFRFQYLKHYGWGPWLYEYMDACDVIIMNLALHYVASGDFEDRTGHTLFDDTQAAITYLTNFSASKKNRIAIWRSTLPVHFDTPNGHYPSDGNISQTPCVAIKEDYSRKEGNEAQEYNKVHKSAFAKFCRTNQNTCGNVKYTCTVNTKCLDFRTIYFYWVANNLTTELEYAKRERSNVTGSILLWHLFDLFDVPMWHPSNIDCSHFCYVPALYEAAFLRLELLLGL